MKSHILSTGETPSLISLTVFAAQAGISPITLWRWRKLGWLVTLNIAGRQYLSKESLAEFKRRAAAGEFAQDHKAPGRARARAAATVPAPLETKALA